METRSLPSVARATVQPSFGAHHVVVGHEDIVEEDLVEIRVTRDHAQRAHLDARARACRSPWW
jgi:hypothetical protein